MSLFHYLTPALLAWELFVSLAILGYGRATLRLFRLQLPIGVAACTGVAIWLLIGGALNLTQTATKPVLRTLLALGLALFFVTIKSRVPHSWQPHRDQWNPKHKFAATLLLLWFAVTLLIHLGTFAWNRFDDLQAYTAFADKASALGALTPDPFSERRITSGVGGALFLNVTMLAGAGNLAIDYLEGAFGLLTLLALIWQLTRRLALTQTRTLAAFATLAIFTLGRANISSVNLSAALFLALLLLELAPQSSPLLTGLLVGAAFTLKSSNIPFCVLFLATTAAFAIYKTRSAKPLVALTKTAFVAAGIALPWAIKHRLDEGTALFPSLGRGFHISAYGFPSIAATVPWPISLAASLPDLLPPLLAFLLLRKRAPQPVLAFLLAATLAAPLFSVAVGAEDIDRFLLPILNLCAVLFVCCMPALSRRSGEISGRTLQEAIAAYALLLAWTTGFIALAIQQDFYRDPGDLALLFGNRDLLTHYETSRTPAEMAVARATIQRAQQAVPPGANILEEVQEAYAFDWQRNPILFADYPGMAGPPPGLPLDGTPDALRAYLLAHNIHYLILDRTLDRNQYPTVDYPGFRTSPQVHPPWPAVFFQREIRGYQRMEFHIGARAQQLLNGLATPRRTRYNNGQLIVINLDQD